MTFNVASGSASSGIDLVVTGRIGQWNDGSGITKVGTGVMHIDGDDTYDGVTDIEGGTLVLGNSSRRRTARSTSAAAHWASARRRPRQSAA